MGENSWGVCVRIRNMLKTEQKWVWKRLRLCNDGYLLHFDFVAIRLTVVVVSERSFCR